MDFQEFRNKYEHKKVEEFPHQVSEKPLVSVCIITYQHISYIKKCLDGILMQKTNFPFEILLGEDNSTDGTREICIEYAEKYPDKIRLFLHHRENNIRTNGKPSGMFNMLYSLLCAKSEYIAICEGDDYWTDSQKLQEQVDFLREHRDCSMVFTSFQTRNKNGRLKTESFSGPEILNHEEFLLNDIKSQYKGAYYYTRTLTLLFKYEIISNTPYEKWMTNAFAADFILKYRALAIGNIGYLNKVTAVYNQNVPGSFTNSKKTKEDIKKQFRDYLKALYYLNRLKPIREEIIKSKIVSLRTRMYFQLANCIPNRKEGIWYLCLNYRKTSLFYILLFIRRYVKSFLL